MAMEPAAISAKPATTMMRVVMSAPDNPAASANGTVSPSAIPITTSRTNSEAVKCVSTCGVCGIFFQVSPRSGGLLFENRLDIDNRSAVDRFQTLHIQPTVPVYAQNLRAMQAYRVGPIRRTGRKYAGQR